jgi:hypothetical protein
MAEAKNQWIAQVATIAVGMATSQRTPNHRKRTARMTTATGMNPTVSEAKM